MHKILSGSYVCVSVDARHYVSLVPAAFTNLNYLPSAPQSAVFLQGYPFSGIKLSYVYSRRGTVKIAVKKGNKQREWVYRVTFIGSYVILI